MKLGDHISTDNKRFRCLQLVARHYERPDSDTILLSGLDYDSNNISIDTLLRAAERVGLKAHQQTLKLNSLFPLKVPAIVELKDGNSLVVFERRDRKNILVQMPDDNEQKIILFKDLKKQYAGKVITFEPQFIVSNNSADNNFDVTIKNRHWFWGTIANYWQHYIPVILAAVSINIIALASPLFVLNVYDRVLPNKAFSTLWVLAAGLGLAILFDFFIKTARAHLIDQVGRQVDIKLSSLIFEKVLNTDMKVRPTSTGGFTNRIQQYEFIREFFTSNTIALFTDFLFIFVFLMVIYLLADWIVFIPLAAVILTLVVGVLLQFLIGRKLKKAQNEAALRQGLLVEAIAAIETLKSLCAEAYFLKKWDRFSKFASGTSEEIKSLSATALNITQLLQQSVTLGIIIGGTYSFSEGKMSMGAIIATVMLSSRTIAPLSQIAMTISRVRQAKLSYKILNELMSLPDDRQVTKNFVSRSIKEGKIEFKSVSFQYPEVDSNVFTNLSFRIAPGECVGVIGQSGVGKTTLGRLITRLYQANQGEILIDDIDIRQYHAHEIRKSIGFVMQETDLFQGSVKENLLIADPFANDDKIVQAAKLSGVEQFVSQHKLGFDMPVGERGSLLSGGQRQCIAFARIILANPKIIILDEPSSSMDRSSIRIMMENLKALVRSDQTLIISTHQEQLLSLVNRLIVLGPTGIVVDGEKQKVLDYLKNNK